MIIKQNYRIVIVVCIICSMLVGNLLKIKKQEIKKSISSTSIFPVLKKITEQVNQKKLEKENIGKIEQNSIQMSNELNYESIEFCSSSSVKSYMNGWLITAPTSKQYKLLHSDNVYVNSKGNFATEYNGQEYIAVAFAKHFGNIGDKFKITLDSGIEINAFMLDQKKQEELIDGICMHPDGSVIEIIIDEKVASNYYGRGENGYILNGNFNNNSDYNGNIVKIEKVI